MPYDEADVRRQQKALHTVAEAGIRQAPHITPYDYERARQRLAANRQHGYRIDGMPAMVSYAGVTSGDREKAERRRVFAEALAAIKAEQEEQRHASIKDEDSSSAQGGTGEAYAQAGADGICAQTAGGDRECRHEDRAGAQGPDRGGDRRELAWTVYPNHRPPALTLEQIKEIYDAYKPGETSVRDLAAQHRVHHNTMLRALKAEAQRRGEESPIKQYKPKALKDDEQELLYQEYITTQISIAALAAKWNIGHTTASRYISAKHREGARVPRKGNPGKR